MDQHLLGDIRLGAELLRHRVHTPYRAGRRPGGSGAARHRAAAHQDDALACRQQRPQGVRAGGLPLGGHPFEEEGQPLRSRADGRHLRGAQPVSQHHRAACQRACGPAGGPHVSVPQR